MGISLLHRLRAISCIWGSLLNSRGGGWECSKEHGVYWIVDLLTFPTRLITVFKAQFPLQIKGILCLAGRHPVAQTQGYQLVCIWGSLVKFQEGGRMF